MALFDSILSAVKSWLGPFGKVIDHLKEIYDKTKGLFGTAERLVQSIKDEVDGWKNFKHDIRFKQRVIQFERAINKTRDLVEGIPAAWRAIVDLVKDIKSQISGTENPAEQAEAAAEDLEASGGIKALLEKFPALARGLTRLLGGLAIIVQALEGLERALDDLQTIVDELKALRLEIERLDTIFLPQTNKRKVLKLADGSTIKIRVGNLHSSV